MIGQNRLQIAQLLVGVSLCAAFGCTGPRSSVSQLQADKQKLLTRVEDEKRRNENLEGENRSLARRLDEAEKQLAQTLDSRGQRFAEIKRPTSANSGAANSSTPNSPPAQLNFSNPNRSAPKELLNPPERETLPTSNGWVPKQPRTTTNRTPTLNP